MQNKLVLVVFVCAFMVAAALPTDKIRHVIRAAKLNRAAELEVVDANSEANEDAEAEAGVEQQVGRDPCWTVLNKFMGVNTYSAASAIKKFCCTTCKATSYLADGKTPHPSAGFKCTTCTAHASQASCGGGKAKCCQDRGLNNVGWGGAGYNIPLADNASELPQVDCAAATPVSPK